MLAQLSVTIETFGKSHRSRSECATTHCRDYRTDGSGRRPSEPSRRAVQVQPCRGFLCGVSLVEGSLWLVIVDMHCRATRCRP